MAKAPRPGQVKRRLAHDIGAEAACAVYERLLEHSRAVAHQAANKLGGDLVWSVTGDGAEAWIRAFDPVGGPVSGHALQRGADLGTRMRTAFEDNLAPGRPVLMLGCDAPEIGVETLAEALQALRDTDVVFVPAHDGGYVLIGMQTLAVEAFFDHGWGGKNVLERSLAALIGAGRRACCLKAMHDLDTIEDLRRFPWLEAPSNRC